MFIYTGRIYKGTGGKGKVFDTYKYYQRERKEEEEERREEKRERNIQQRTITSFIKLKK